MKRFNINKNLLNKIGKSYFDRQISRIITVLVILLVVLVVKLINTNTTNYIIQTLEKNIYHKFSLKEDGGKVKDYLLKTVDSSKIAIEEFTKEIINYNK